MHRPDEPGTGLATVLLWHGRGPDERDVLAPLAQATAALGLLVLVPDWRADAPDAGLTHLTESVSFAREQAAAHGGDPLRLTLAGWSLGAKNAVALALGPGAWRPRAVVAIAGGYTTSARTTGGTPLDDARHGPAAPKLPLHLIHGTADEVVPVEQSRELRTALAAHHWPVTLDEPETDHAGVVLTRYSPAHQRCLPAPDHPPGLRTAALLAKYAKAQGPS
ncbi:alpha/beta hydrolase [Kitasatospora sp. NPDC002227]|uniref:alpha/beta hydrolase n=1 Tax=Kitasatospora sp. NPDC002227 TaxID=3154773 RepID=UPI0033212EC5